MKKLFLLALCSVFAVNTFAQDEVPAKYPSNKGFVTNGFWDNWEISVGGGVAIESVGNGSKATNHGTFGERLGWEVNGSLTKWIHPVWGVRVEVQGGKYNAYKYDRDLEDANGKVSGIDNKLVTKHLFAHADFMINLSNWIGGYRENRVYYAVPFAGMGYQRESGDNMFAATAGLLNKFRLCKQLDLNIELKWAVYPEHGHRLHPIYNGLTTYSYSATAGLTYRFNKRDWTRKGPETDVSGYLAQLAEKDAALAASIAEADRLRELANKPAVEKIVEKTTEVYVGGKMLVFFSIGKSNLTDAEKLRLDLKADQIKNGPADKVYLIEGHADSKTGTAAINQKLSEQRAKAVYDYLVSKGVNAGQLEYKGVGDKKETFTTAETNRVVIID